MTSIVRFAPVASAFDPEATRILGKAFDMACALVGRTAQPTATREALARAIVEAAQQGEYDPHRLRDAALAALDPIDRQKPDRHPRDV